MRVSFVLASDPLDADRPVMSVAGSQPTIIQKDPKSSAVESVS
ncbi:hypothetical protein OHC50_19100 [Paenarthrobacter ilicis]